MNISLSADYHAMKPDMTSKAGVQKINKFYKNKLSAVHPHQIVFFLALQVDHHLAILTPLFPINNAESECDSKRESF